MNSKHECYTIYVIVNVRMNKIKYMESIIELNIINIKINKIIKKIVFIINYECFL